MSSAIVTMILIIYSDTGVSSRTQKMTLAECQAEMTAAKASAQKNELVAGGCILAPLGTK